MLQPPGEADGHHGQLLLPPQAGAQLNLLTLVMTGSSPSNTTNNTLFISPKVTKLPSSQVKTGLPHTGFFFLLACHFT